MNILFDGNYLFHRNFSVFSHYYKESMEDVLRDEDKKQVLIRKCVIDLCHTVKNFKNVDKVAFVIDSSSWRYQYHNDYKYALTKVRDSSYKYFLETLNEFESLLRKKGLIVSRVNGAEGDDLLYLWSVYFDQVLNEDLVIVTGDSDIKQLITKRVSLFNNNSKNLAIYCNEDNKDFWNKNISEDVSVITTKPFEILLYKVIMGDKSDNILKLKRGFGDKAFEKFIDYISPYEIPVDFSLNKMASWIFLRFSQFVKIEDEDKIFKQIFFNLKMTWLNYSSYEEVNISGENLLEKMLDDINNQKLKYSYNKKYNLESFYGMLIKK